jgi:hypothetical protein
MSNTKTNLLKFDLGISNDFLFYFICRLSADAESKKLEKIH